MKTILKYSAAFLLVPMLLGGCNKETLGSPKTKYWINSETHVRHVPGCRYYGDTKKGYYTNEPEGTPCGICGGK